MTDIRSRASTAQKGTRALVLALLREGAWSVDDLAERLGLTDNAVRFHLDALERAGTVEKGALRRSGSVGQPAVIYSLARAEKTRSHALTRRFSSHFWRSCARR